MMNYYWRSQNMKRMYDYKGGGIRRRGGRWRRGGVPSHSHSHISSLCDSSRTGARRGRKGVNRRMGRREMRDEK